MPKVDETLAQLAGANIFSKLDAHSGFWQIPLAEESHLLTTFVTPCGRYCFNKLPFGISSAPELFQNCVSNVLAGLEGVVCQIDDVLVFGKDQSEHDDRVVDALERFKKAGVTFNSEKCEFNKHLKFLGQLIDADGIRADSEKASAILKMEPPTNISELRRFMGMANQLSTFSSSSRTRPTTEGTAEHQESMVVGPRPRTRILRSQGRCLIVWAKSSPPTGPGYVEASCVCCSCPYGYGETLCTNREEGARSDIVL